MRQPGSSGGGKLSYPPQHLEEAIERGQVRRTRPILLGHLELVDQRHQAPRSVLDDMRGKEGELDRIGFDQIQPGQLGRQLVAGKSQFEFRRYGEHEARVSARTDDKPINADRHHDLQSGALRPGGNSGHCHAK
ncbi:hypothetical protein [Rhizobium leguminosarum]